jgi:hypothetical protein
MSAPITPKEWLEFCKNFPEGVDLNYPPRAPRPWVGLTYEEQRELYKKHEMDGWGHFYNAIEAKLKEKNNG